MNKRLHLNIDSKEVLLMGLKLTVIDKETIIDLIINSLYNEIKSTIIMYYANIRAYNLAKKDNYFRSLFNKASIVFVDGYGVWLAAKIMGLSIGQRMTPPDWFEELLLKIQDHDGKVFFLGDTEEIITKYVNQVKNKYSKLNVVGFSNGFFGDKNEEIINKINNSAADVLVIGMGMPIQETWAFENKEMLNVKVVIVVGAMFYWAVYPERRAPRFFSDYGLEWFYRLLTEPKKVYKRYLFGIPSFGKDLFISFFLKRLNKKLQ